MGETEGVSFYIYEPPSATARRVLEGWKPPSVADEGPDYADAEDIDAAGLAEAILQRKGGG